MAEWLLVSCLVIAVLATSVSVLCAVACSRAVSVCISQAKAWQKAQLDLTDLHSSLDSATEQLRRAAARTRMRAVRGSDTVPETKAEARARYLNGKTPQQVAMEALAGRVEEQS